jgi:hypothetical protein
MPLTEKGREIMAAMKRQYGEEKGEEVFYASKNAGKITGVDSTGAFVTGQLEKPESRVAVPLHDEDQAPMPVQSQTAAPPTSAAMPPTGPVTSAANPTPVSPQPMGDHRIVGTLRDLARAAGAR